jgi:hypothetical protein
MRLSPSIHVWGIVQILVTRFTKVNKGHQVLEDEDPPPAGNSIPGDYLFLERNKPDRIL